MGRTKPPPPAPTISAEEWKRRQYEAQQRFEMFRAPGECTICLDGKTYSSRRHHHYGWVWDLPVRYVNTKLNGVRIDLADGDWLELRLDAVREKISQP